MKNVTRRAWFIALSASTIAAGLGFAGPVDAADPEFSYSGDRGPGYWSELDSAWSACAGTAAHAKQSPIDIDHVSVDRNLRPLALHLLPTTINVVNNGHTLEQKYEGTHSTISFEGKFYELLQFHFHALSEHAVLGERGVMELHSVFQEPGTGNKLVIGLFFEIGRKGNPFLQTLIDAGLPKKSGDTKATSTRINLADALTQTSSYFTYPGSLTTPPCTENVTWIVLATPAQVSPTQFQSFRHILGNDFRPLQEANGRVIRATHALSPHRQGEGNSSDPSAKEGKPHG